MKEARGADKTGYSYRDLSYDREGNGNITLTEGIRGAWNRVQSWTWVLGLQVSKLTDQLGEPVI